MAPGCNANVRFCSLVLQSRQSANGHARALLFMPANLALSTADTPREFSIRNRHCAWRKRSVVGFTESPFLRAVNCRAYQVYVGERVLPL